MMHDNAEARVGTVIGLIMQSIAWLVPDAPLILRFILSVFSIVIIILSYTVRYDGLRSTWASFRAFWLIHYPLAIVIIVCISVLFFLSGVEESRSVIAFQLIIAAFLTASLVGLIIEQQKKPDIRIVKGTGDAIYLVENGVRRHIPDPLTYTFVSLNTFASLEPVSDLELTLLREGKQLPKITDCPLVRGSGDSIFVFWEGKRKLLPDAYTIQFFFGNRVPQKIADEELEKVPRIGTLPAIMPLNLARGNGEDSPKLEDKLSAKATEVDESENG